LAPPFPLEGESAFEDIGDLVRVGMNMPGQHGARRERIDLRVDLLAWIAGKDEARASKRAGKCDGEDRSFRCHDQNSFILGRTRSKL